MNKCGLERIRLGRHDHMTYIDLVNNNLKSFEVGDLPQIKDLQLWKNKIEKLSLGKMPKLWRLNLANNNLKEIDLSNAPSLLSFFAFENPNLKQVNFSKCINLKNVILSDTKIDKLDFSHNKFITSIEASNVPDLQIVNLKNDGFEKEDFEYLFIFPENKSLRKIVVDAGDEYDIVTKMVSRIVSNNPGMNIEVVTN